MKYPIRTTAIAGLLSVCAVAFPVTASASLFYDSTLSAPAQGFGTAPRDLTLQANGSAIMESGGVGVDASGNIVFGSIVPDAGVYDGNGITNSTSLADLPMPRADDAKYGVPTIGSLGITTASQIGILFNATETNGDSVNVTDLTLKFFGTNGTLLGAIDGQYNFSGSNAGNGVAGFTFKVTDDELTFVNGLLRAGGSGTRLALEASISDVSGGPESFLIYNLTTLPPSVGGTANGTVPEPDSVALLGLGLLGLVLSNKKKA